MSYRFDILATAPDSYARTGLFHTPHGEVRTPIFMPVGTVGSVKGLWHSALRQETGSRILLGNTYHLYLRPGLSVLRRAGGLHGFTTWAGPMLTDSGGFQVFSLTGQRRLREDGVHFRSHIDGRPLLFTPERVIDIERVLGADIMMVLDECPPGDSPYDYARASLQLTLRWLTRAYSQYRRTAGLYGYPQALFPIIQGGQYQDLRRQSAEACLSYAAHGIAIGGLAVGEPEEVMYQVLESLAGIIPQSLPRYLMGVGTPWNLLEAIGLGVDMFDCVMPTRNGRNGMLFTWDGVRNAKNMKYRFDFTPLAGAAGRQGYTMAYLRHLFSAGETLAQSIASLHNVEFYLELMGQAQQHIASGDFAQWKRAMVPRLKQRL